MKQPAIQKPAGLTEVLLHACCAPCSSAIVEWMLANGVKPVIYYFNPNIWPREEYEIRKNESKRHAESLGLRWIDGDYDHEAWRQGVCGLEHEPERGRRCEQCFLLRLTAAARMAQELGLAYFTTTLASSRWKNLEQINQAGLLAEQAVNGTLRQAQGPQNDSPRTLSFAVPELVEGAKGAVFRQAQQPQVHYWAQNWRKGGLYERRNQLLKEYHFYNQQYCGCEFSQRPKSTENEEKIKNDE